MVCFGSLYLFCTKLELWQKLLLLSVLETEMHVSYTCVSSNKRKNISGGHSIDIHKIKIVDNSLLRGQLNR